MFEEHDAFDLALALYHWLQHNWIDMDDKYKSFCELTNHYKPARSEEFFDNIDGSALDVYHELTDDNYKEALDIVLSYNSED